MTFLRRVAGEPLVQFLILGAILAALWAAKPKPQAPQAARETIVVSAGEVEQLKTLFARTWQRPPTAAELSGLVESRVSEEVLYRAGIALGLDEDDPIVRRRVAQKMQFLVEPAPGDLAPTQSDLEAYLEANPERYRTPPKIGFDQIFIKRDGGTDVDARAAEISRSLEAGADPVGLSDQTLLPATVEFGPVHSIESIFGPDFTNALLDLPQDTWVGPINSPYGAHMIKVTRYEAPQNAILEDVRDDVAEDWAQEQRTKALEARLAQLRDSYNIVIEDQPATPTTDGAPDAPAAQVDDNAPPPPTGDRPARDAQ